MERKSDMEIYQNAQIYYERENMEEDSVRKLPRRLLEIRSSGALYFRGLPRRIPISIPESDPDLKNMYIQKSSNDFKKQKK